MRAKYAVLIAGVFAASALLGSGWIASPRAGEPVAAPTAAAKPVASLLASLERRAKPQMSVRGETVSADSCIPSGQACVLNGTPCCGNATCQGKFPNTSCQ